MDGIWINFALLVATGGATAVAWWQAIEASRSRKVAAAAESAALSAWEGATNALTRANQVADVTLRGPYAYALLEFGTAILAARFAGSDNQFVLKLASERSNAITEKGFGVGDAPTEEIFRWVGFYSRLCEIGEPVEIEAYRQANELVRDRIMLWYRDPQHAVEVIELDPRVAIPK